MATQCDQDWQSTMNTVLERNCHMFNNPLMSDVAFTCGESKRKCFYAHKYVLATSSAVFYAMFYGDLAEKNTVIHLSDTDEQGLEEFLRFLYTDQCTLTPEISLKLLYLAKKYMVPSLTKRCVTILQNDIKPEIVATILNQAIHFDEKELEGKCWKVVESQTSEVVTSEAFKDISQLTLTSLLTRKTVTIPEVKLFQAVLNWSSHQCSKNGLETTSDNRRSVLGDAVYQICFLWMTEREFAQHVHSSGLLTAEEMVAIYGKFNGLDSTDLKWKLPKKQETYDVRFARFSLSDIDHPNNSQNVWSYSGDLDCLSFSVNKTGNRTVKFHGVRLFGDDNGSEYEVSLDVNGEEVDGTYTTELNDEGIYGFDVMLPTPISLNNYTRVKIKAKIQGPLSYYGRWGKSSIEVDGVTVKFDQSSYGLYSNKTNSRTGQFPQIILLI